MTFDDSRSFLVDIGRQSRFALYGASIAILKRATVDFVFDIQWLIWVEPGLGYGVF